MAVRCVQGMVTMCYVEEYLIEQHITESIYGESSHDTCNYIYNHDFFSQARILQHLPSVQRLIGQRPGAW